MRQDTDKQTAETEHDEGEMQKAEANVEVKDGSSDVDEHKAAVSSENNGADDSEYNSSSNAQDYPALKRLRNELNNPKSAASAVIAILSLVIVLEVLLSTPNSFLTPLVIILHMLSVFLAADFLFDPFLQD